MSEFSDAAARLAEEEGVAAATRLAQQQLFAPDGSADGLIELEEWLPEGYVALVLGLGGLPDLLMRAWGVATRRSGSPSDTRALGAAARRAGWSAASWADPFRGATSITAAAYLGPGEWMAIRSSCKEGELINVTPHMVSMLDERGVAIREYPSRGLVRAGEHLEEQEDVAGMAVARVRYEGAMGLTRSMIESRGRYIVSWLSAQVMRGAGMAVDRLLIPDQEVYGPDGRIAGAQSFSLGAELAAGSKRGKGEERRAVRGSTLVNLARPGTMTLVGRDGLIELKNPGTIAAVAGRTLDGGIAHGIPTRRVVLEGTPNGLGPSVEGRIYVTNSVVAEAAWRAGREDVVSTGDYTRDEFGAISMAGRLVVPGGIG